MERANLLESLPTVRVSKPDALPVDVSCTLSLSEAGLLATLTRAGSTRQELTMRPDQIHRISPERLSLGYWSRRRTAMAICAIALAALPHTVFQAVGQSVMGSGRPNRERTVAAAVAGLIARCCCS